jgi:hypothetical protein
VNGPSLVNKIRYVAVTLLDPPFSQEALSERVQGGHTYLMDLLQILSEIDRVGAELPSWKDLIWESLLIHAESNGFLRFFGEP